ncbi:hypothetical protein BG000_001771 [Podila horticola]|nr:hypothetical protein BG000_001771 [Podila horticola]
MASPVTATGGHFGQPMAAPAQTHYPIPPTTLLHPLPRRSQSVRVKGNPMARNDSPSRQLNGPAAVTRGRSSIEYTRLPGGSIGVAGADFGGTNGPYIRGFSDPLSLPGSQQLQQHQPMISPPNSMGYDKQAHQFQISAQQQQQQRESPTQGYYITSPPFGYPMYPNDQYSHMHQQIVQPGRR